MRRRGNALLTAIILLAILSTLLAAFLNAAADDTRSYSRRAGRFEIKRSANSVNRLAAQFFWSSYAQTVVGETSLKNMRSHMDTLGLTDQAGLVPTPVDATAMVGLGQNDGGEYILGDTVVASIMVHREDDGRVTNLFVTSRTSTVEGLSPLEHVTSDVFQIEAPRWSGMDFALLANNINCIMCHTQIDDVERVYAMGGPGGPAGPGRARVGSIESFQFRDDPDSTIAGTLYLGGEAIDRHGEAISNWSGLNLKAAALDSDGRAIQDAFGSLTLQDLDPADATTPAPYENLYLNYLDLSEKVDGDMPDSFPPPFRDDGGLDPVTGAITTAGENNRVVDDNEFSATVDSFAGTISGGQIGLSPKGTVISTPSEVSSLESGTEPSLGALTDGNVILTGTDLNPIRIDGSVAIDGDLIISGPIEGAGSLWVRGNIYVRGDLEYDDATIGSARQFGVGDSGLTNAFGMTAGGNVVIGDIFRPQWGSGDAVDGTDSGSWNFTMEEAAAFNGREWVKTQPELPGEPVVTTVMQPQNQEVFIETTTVTQVARYIDVPNGTFTDQPVYGPVQTGTVDAPVYTTVHHPSTLPPPYDNSWSEQVQTGTTPQPVYTNQQIGTTPVENTDSVFDGYDDVSTTTYTSHSPPQFQIVDVPVQVTTIPMFPNPEYKGPDYTPRFYAFGPGDPVVVQNKDGYFDPVKDTWIVDEGVESWDPAALTLADPTDPTDPILNPSGTRAAVITTLEPSASWIDSDLLRGLITDSLTARDPNEPLKVDATVYSSNSIFGVVPNSAAEGTTGSMRVQGALLAADVGLLAPTGLDLFYDQRGQEVLDIRDESELGLKFVGTLPAPLL